MADSTLTIAPIVAPFDAVAEAYDETFTYSLIGRAQRQAVIREMDRVFSPGQRILEINCGTGADAEYLASRGLHVVACDSSPGMIGVARRRVAGSKFTGSVEFRVLPTENLGALSGVTFGAGTGRGASKVPSFGGLLSNFAGLNCVENLQPLARDIARLLEPGARALVCVFGRCCAWEILWHSAHGRFGKAFRRFRAAGDLARLADGVAVHVRYPSLRAVERAFEPYFRLQAWKGIGLAVPPSYLESLARRFPRILSGAAAFDRRVERLPVLGALADHVLLTFERAP